MIEIPFTLDDACAVVRSTKEERVADGDDFLPGQLYFWRGNRLLAIVFTRPDIELYLDIASVCVPGFGATGMILCMESCGCPHKRHPSGREWKRHEFQELYESGRGKEFDIREELTVKLYQRRLGIDGRGCTNRFRSMPFVVDGRTVTWGDDSDGEGVMEGFLTRSVNKIFEHPPMDMEATRLRFFAMEGQPVGDIPHQRLHADLATLRVISHELGDDVQFGYFADGDDPEEMEIVAESMKTMWQGIEDLDQLLGMMTN